MTADYGNTCVSLPQFQVLVLQLFAVTFMPAPTLLCAAQDWREPLGIRGFMTAFRIRSEKRFIVLTASGFSFSLCQPHVRSSPEVLARAASAARRLWGAAQERAVRGAHGPHAGAAVPAGRRAHILRHGAGGGSGGKMW